MRAKDVIPLYSDGDGGTTKSQQIQINQQKKKKKKVTGAGRYIPAGPRQSSSALPSPSGCVRARELPLPVP